MIAPPSLASQLDIPRCMKMALVHDMAEGLVGDLTPVDGVPKVEKNRREAATMDWVSQSLLGKVYGGSAGLDLRAVWQEYEDSETLESKFVHDVDKIELLLQMVEYERAYNCTKDLSEFSWVAQKITLPEMQTLAAEITKERDELWTSKDREPRGPPAAAAAVIKEQHDEYYGGGSKVNGHSYGDVNGTA